MMLPIRGIFNSFDCCFTDVKRTFTDSLVFRMNQVMTKLQKMKEDEYSSFVRVLFGLTTPSPVEEVAGDVEWVDLSLNDSQKDAIRFALGSREVALIHGPPGVSLRPLSYTVC